MLRLPSSSITFTPNFTKTGNVVQNWNTNTYRQLSHVAGIPVLPFKKERKKEKKGR